VEGFYWGTVDLSAIDLFGSLCRDLYVAGESAFNINGGEEPSVLLGVCAEVGFASLSI
jgi:hypothetical protein